MQESNLRPNYFRIVYEVLKKKKKIRCQLVAKIYIRQFHYEIKGNNSDMVKKNC